MKETNPIIESNLLVHPYAAAFPMMDSPHLEELANEIKTQGQIQPIILSDDRTTLIDGRNRLEACKRAGVNPQFESLSDFCERTGTNYSSPIQLICALNLVRRQLSQTMRAKLAVLKREHQQQEHSATLSSENERAAAANSDETRDDPECSEATQASLQKPPTFKAVAEEHDVSPEQVKLTDRVRRERPDLFENLSDEPDGLTVNAAVEIMRKEKKDTEKKAAMNEVINTLKATETDEFITVVVRGEVLETLAHVRKWIDLEESTRVEMRKLLARGYPKRVLDVRFCRSLR
jgi:hypothetical protein